MTRGAAGLLAGIAVLVAAGLWLRRPDDPPHVAARAGSASPVRKRPPADSVGVGELPLPASLEGTTADGALVVDGDGRFVPTPDAIDLFDYYLSASGEEPDGVIRGRILAAIRARLSGSAAASAERLLDDYLSYRGRAAELLTGALVGENLERRLQYLRELRREAFGSEVARALFGEAEARWFADLERRRLSRDPTLDADERRRRLEDLEAELPEEVRAAREPPLAHSLLREDEARLRAEGAGPAEIDRLRRERFGDEAAERLARLDAERARWQSRIAEYRRERDRLLERTVPGEREALVEEVRARHFDQAERVRVDALDRLERAQGPGQGT